MRSPHPGTRLPARSPRLPRAVVPTAVTCALVASALSVLAAPTESASGATPGTVVGATPVALYQPTDPEMGAIAPAADAATNGMFGTQAAWPVIPLHAALSRSGRLITFGTPYSSPAQGGFTYDDWDPSLGFGAGSHVDTASMHDYNSFCNGLVTLDDGRMMMVGGNSTTTTMLYDPDTRTQDMGQNVAQQRWYATTLHLADGRVLVLGGGSAYNTTAYQTPDDQTGVAVTPEITDGSGTGAWTRLTGATSLYAFGAQDNRWWYPRAFNGRNGTVIGISNQNVWTLSTAGTGSVTPAATLPYQPGVSGSQVMYAPGRILVAGGGQIMNDDDRAATNAAATIDFTGGTVTTASTAPMNDARNWLNLTVLPNGEVFANGGTRIGLRDGDANSVRRSEIWNPATGTWRTAATAQRTRTYHSTSLVLPSGAVFTGGGGAPGPESNLNAELYYPAYLFTTAADGSVQWASRPTITSIAGSLTYGGKVALTIGDGRAIASASLIPLASVTHSESTDQRRIPLDVTQNGGTVTATLPASWDTMPAGSYELTVLDAKGVPSPAQIVTIDRNGPGQVSFAAAVAGATGTNAAPVGTTAGGAANGAGGAVGTGTGAGTGTAGAAGGTAGNAGTATGTGTATGKAAPAPRLVVGAVVGLAPAAKHASRVAHRGSKVLLRAGKSGASTWIVHPGLGSKRGVSLESADRRGWFLAAPRDGIGALTLVKRRHSASFGARATFTQVKGLMGHDAAVRLTARHGVYLKTSGTRVATARAGSSARTQMAMTFTVVKGAELHG